MRPPWGELSDEELDLQLREIADRFIDLANEQAQRFHKENVSEAMMFAASGLMPSSSRHMPMTCWPMMKNVIRRWSTSPGSTEICW